MTHPGRWSWMPAAISSWAAISAPMRRLEARQQREPALDQDPGRHRHRPDRLHHAGRRRQHLRHRLQHRHLGVPRHGYGSGADAFVAKLNSSGTVTWKTSLVRVAATDPLRYRMSTPAATYPCQRQQHRDLGCPAAGLYRFRHECRRFRRRADQRRGAHLADPPSSAGTGSDWSARVEPRRRRQHLVDGSASATGARPADATAAASTWSRPS